MRNIDLSINHGCCYFEINKEISARGPRSPKFTQYNLNITIDNPDVFNKLSIKLENIEDIKRIVRLLNEFIQDESIIK